MMHHVDDSDQRELRRQVVARAESLCEYCLLAEEDTFYGCQVDHIISEKHHGPTQEDNLAYACVFCNRAKGSDVGSIDGESGQFVRCFNPRTDRWSEHFRLDGCRIEGLTPIGVVTVRLLAFNRGERLFEREALQRMGRYSSITARKRMKI